ncbi:MAG: hypothetical protein HOP11_13590 [Saprospiraceae bacterium]|nr:hypothetical protein [Saprospiraceae bacterium]
MNSKAIIVLIISMCALLIQCRKENADSKQESCVTEEQITSDYDKFYIYYPGLQENGYARAIKINKEWNASAIAGIYNNKLQVSLTTYLVENNNDLNYKAELFIFEINNAKTKCYFVGSENILDTVKVLCLAVNGDAIQNAYVPNQEIKNQFQIDAFDIVNKRVSGKFNLTMKKDRLYQGGPWYNPDELRFFNGEFHCNIVD